MTMLKTMTLKTMTLKTLAEAQGMPLIMGVVNVTPDSFSDGGQWLEREAAVAHGRALMAGGADILDIGGESTRPGAGPVSEAEELRRIIPVIEALAGEGIRLSVDTFKPDVAKAAIQAGAKIWNDVSALRHNAQSLDVAVEANCDIILMHMNGAPQTMQIAPHYDDVVSEVESFLINRAEAAIKAGVAQDRIWIDPGIGFGKTLEHNLALISATDRLSAHGYPLVMAASNKRFIAALEEREGALASAADQRLGGSLAAHLYAMDKGAKMLRVHDVAAMKQAMRVWRSLFAQV